MAMRILVPLDGSRFSEQALKSAYNIALLSRATVHLVRVIRPGVQVATEVGFSATPPVSDLIEEAEVYLQAHAAGAPLAIATRTSVLHGPESVADLLARYIATAGIDLVVMSTHGRTGLSRLWNGSEADMLVRNVKVPVLLLRPHKGRAGPEVEAWDARHVLIPLDGSERAEAVLKPAVEFGWLSGARYTLLQVVRPPLRETYAEAVATLVDDDEIEHELLLARCYLETVANRLRLLGFHADTLAVVHDSIAHAIDQQALEQGADMIALGTHGRSGWSRMTLGSVTQDVLHTARLPVLVIRSVDTEVDVDRWATTVAAC